MCVHHEIMKCILKNEALQQAALACTDRLKAQVPVRLTCVSNIYVPEMRYEVQRSL